MELDVGEFGIWLESGRDLWKIQEMKGNETMTNLGRGGVELVFKFARDIGTGMARVLWNICFEWGAGY